MINPNDQRTGNPGRSPGRALPHGQTQNNSGNRTGTRAYDCRMAANESPDAYRLIFETISGSTAYGLNREDSDVDLRGVIVGTRAWYFGISKSPEQIELTADHVRYEIRKFLRLASEANPSVIELLFTDQIHHRFVSASGELLLANRHLFLSQRVAERFGNYAMGQLKRIRTHRAHLLQPPKHMPTRAEFNLPDRTVIPADQLAAVESMLRNGELDETEAADVSPNFLELLYRERRYKSAMTGWQSYQQWQRERNPKRSELEAKFGYDTKHAMHLVRLQRTGLDALQTGTLVITRQDRDELLAIRDGAWTFEELETEAERVNSELLEAAKASVLPAVPNNAAIEAICIQIIESEIS
jgi:uncharacterized protein